MFYLKQLFFVGKDHLVLAFTNITLLLVFTIVTQNRAEITNFFSIESKTSSAPYFNALVSSGASPDYISRKMKNLPGVSSVEVTRSGKIAEEAKNFLTQLGESADAFPGSYNAFKVVIEQNTKPQSRKLIKEYFTRLVGKNDVTFTGMKRPMMRAIQNSPAFALFAKWSDVYLAALAALGWLFTLFLLSRPVASQSFVIERFQRRTSASLKIYLWLAGLPVTTVLGLYAFSGGKMDWLGFAPGLALLAVGSLLFIKKAQAPKRFI